MQFFQKNEKILHQIRRVISTFNIVHCKISSIVLTSILFFFQEEIINFTGHHPQRFILFVLRGTFIYQLFIHFENFVSL